jgi:hypothetical protein
MITRQQLDEAICAAPGCNHDHGGILYLHAACHPGAGLSVAYDNNTGSLMISCHQCAKLVSQIAVAAGLT